MTSSELPTDVASLTEWLMGIPSTSSEEIAVTTALATSLERRGWRVTRIPVNEGRFCVLATSGAGPFVTLSTHLDTVPPYIPPRREGNVIHGRGSCDAKGIAAAMIIAGERVRADGLSVAMLYVVGEETTHDGAHAADEWLQGTGFKSIALVNGEPTESTLALGTKGAIRFIVRTEGVAAHSAYPHLGVSATKELVALLASLDSVDLPRDDVLGDTTVNIGKLSGGVADNVVAPSAEARLMARTVTSGDDVYARLVRWAGDRAHVERSIEVPPVKLGTLPGFKTSVVAFATDIPAMPSWGTPYLYGPGSIHVAHRDDEHVRIDDLNAAVDAYERIVRSLAANTTS